MLKSIMAMLGNQMYVRDLSSAKSKLVHLSGSDVMCNTVLSIIEKALANDFSAYYDEFDADLGVNYESNVTQCTLEFDCGKLIFTPNSFVKKMTARRNFHCLRCIDDAHIRSFISPSTQEQIPTNFGVALTSFSSVLSNSAWLRLEKLYNNLVGSKVLLLNIKDRTLNFDFDACTTWSKDALEIAYMLLSESFISANRGIRVILISKLTCLNTAQFTALLDALEHIGNLDCILFMNEVSGSDAFNLTV